MEQPLDVLRGAAALVRAAPVGLALARARAPSRTRGRPSGTATAGAASSAWTSTGPDDLGDHVAGAAHDHRVALPHVLARDLVLVVQRGVVTVTPPTETGSRTANGVTMPVRPVCTSIARSSVVRSSGGNL